MEIRLRAFACALLMACGSAEGSPPRDAGGGGTDGRALPDDGGEAEPDAGAVDAGAPTSACPLSQEARMLMHEVIDETVAGGTYVATMSHYREVAFALFLPGVEEGNLGVASLAFDCMDESWYDPYCSEGGGITPGGGGEPSGPFWETRNRCGRLGCGGTDVDVQQVYMTMRPHMLPDDRHVFTYDSVEPPASVTWAENPLVLYRIERASADRWRVRAQIAHTVDFALTSGGSVALSHSGSIDVDVNGGRILTATYDLSFPDVAGGAVVDADVAIDGLGVVTGAVVHDGTRLAEWGGAIDHPTFTWLPPCAE